MFKEMRRSDRQIGEEEALKLLKEAQYGVLSTIGENGYAYGVPLNYAYSDGALYFHCAQEGGKLNNIAFNNKVSFCVLGTSKPVADKFTYKYTSTIVFGKCTEVFDSEKEAALLALIEKYSGEYMEAGRKYIRNDFNVTKVMKISIEHITGKANS